MQIQQTLRNGVYDLRNIPAQNGFNSYAVRTLDAAGKTFPAGTVVRAVVDGAARETVIDRQGQLWIGELLPATGFTVTQGGKGCKFVLPPPDDSTGLIRLRPTDCQDLQ